MSTPEALAALQSRLRYHFARPALLASLAALKAQDLEAYLHVEVPTILERRRACYAQADYTIATAGLELDRVAQIVACLASCEGLTGPGRRAASARGRGQGIRRR